jgi:hypothetical protein
MYDTVFSLRAFPRSVEERRSEKGREGGEGKRVVKVGQIWHPIQAAHGSDGKNVSERVVVP